MTIRRWSWLIMLLLTTLGMAADVAVQPSPLSGELILADPVQRTFRLRLDRSDQQAHHEFDRAVACELRAEASLSHHGASVDLRMIPLGTHLHAQVLPATGNGRERSVPVLALEDDVSRSLRLGRSWRVAGLTTTTIDLEEFAADGAVITPAARYHHDEATRWWRAQGRAQSDDVRPGTTLLVNLTRCTLAGPGHLTDGWLDRQSIDLARATQAAANRVFLRWRGLPGRIAAVDNQRAHLSVVLLPGADVVLLGELDAGATVRVAVADERLRTYDVVNDAITARRAADQPGDGNLVIVPERLLEGFRPGRLVRLYAAAWEVSDLPREEVLWR